MPRAFTGNDVVDLAFVQAGDDGWIARHLAPGETGSPERFWALFAAKEAAYKALAQGGVPTPYGGFKLLKADLRERRVLHIPSGYSVELADLIEDADKVHCVCVFDPEGSDWRSRMRLGWRVADLPAGRDPSDFAREELAGLAGEPERLAVADVSGALRLLRGGKPVDCSASLSHSGRFVACSLLS